MRMGAGDTGAERTRGMLFGFVRFAAIYTFSLYGRRNVRGEGGRREEGGRKEGGRV